VSAERTTPITLGDDRRVSTALELSVIIPTRARPTELRRCLKSLASQDADVPFEVIVVDDGSEPPLVIPAEAPRNTRLVRRVSAQGPAAARNLGAATAGGDVLVFTDDDTVPSARWLGALAEHLSLHPDHLGVEGPTESPHYDPLTEHSVDSRVAGAYLTCNVAYRRSAFEALGGFHEGFPYPHCEDLDFGLRLTRIGKIGFAPEMQVVHPPRPMSAAQEVRRGRMVSSEILLRTRHPDMYPDYGWLSVRLRPVAGLARARLRLLRSEWARGRASPRRLVRWAAVSAGQTAVAVIACLRLVRTRPA
jgi:GT2 family glycosyltransferase